MPFRKKADDGAGRLAKIDLFDGFTPAELSRVAELVEEIDAEKGAILTEQARKEGKPDNIIEKMIEGRMRNFYAEHVLSEQPFVKDDKQSVGKAAAAGGMKLKKFVHWKLGETAGEKPAA